MPEMRWDDGLCTGHLGLDLKHRQLAECMRNVQQAQRAGGSASMVNQLILGLWKGVELHFEEEEALMLRSNFPGYDRHAAAHRRILQILSHKMDAYLEVSCDSASLMRTFHAWFVTHTAEEDAELGKFISGEHAADAAGQALQG